MRDLLRSVRWLRDLVHALRRVRSVARSVADALIVLRQYAESQPFALRLEEEKRFEIRRLVEMFGLRVFVETGTYLGKTTLLLSEVCDRSYTIELDRALYERAAELFADRTDVTVIHGDSAERLPEVVAQLDQPAAFWLDGHYSGGVTGRALEDTPIMAELRAILDHPIKDHLVLIDDARLFVGRDGYPRVERLRDWVESNSPYSLRVIDDVIRLHREDI